MEYIFGTTVRGGVEIEILKTVGDEHTELSGRVTTTRKYTDRIIEDTFTVAEKYRSKDGADGKKYDWYFIKDHSRDTDWYTPKAEDIQAQIDYIAMMADVELDTEESGAGDGAF